MRKQLNFWRKKLEDIEALQLPLDHMRPPRQTYDGQRIPFELSRDVTERLNHLARENSSTLFMVVLATFQLLLARYSGQTDIVVGTSIANRTHREIERLIGFFVNTLVIRSKLETDAPFTVLLKQLSDYLIESYDYQDVPFEMLVQELQPARDMSQNPLFQVFFVFQNTPAVERRFANGEWSREQLTRNYNPF